MAGTLATLQPSFAAGELSPSLYGRVDLAKYHAGAATLRNFFVNYRGGASTRAGTKFVGQSKQSTTAGYPPRLIPFQFNLTQGYIIELGDQYARFITNGGYIVEGAATISGITQASPGVFTTSTSALATATAVTSGVTASYAPGDTVTLAGGTATTTAVAKVTTTAIKSIAQNAAGTGYAANDTRGQGVDCYLNNAKVERTKNSAITQPICSLYRPTAVPPATASHGEGPLRPRCAMKSLPKLSVITTGKGLKADGYKLRGVFFPN